MFPLRLYGHNYYIYISVSVLSIDVAQVFRNRNADYTLVLHTRSTYTRSQTPVTYVEDVEKVNGDNFSF